MKSFNVFFGKINIWLGFCIRYTPICALASLSLTGCGKSEPNVFSTEVKVLLEGRGIPTKAAICALDSINQQAVTSGAYHAQAGRSASFSGWAWSKENITPSTYVAVRLTGNEGMKPVYAYTSTRGARPDVTAALQIPAESKAGFVLDAIALPNKAGSYKVELLQVWDTAIDICEVTTPLVLE